MVVVVVVVVIVAIFGSVVVVVATGAVATGAVAPDVLGGLDGSTWLVEFIIWAVVLAPAMTEVDAFAMLEVACSAEVGAERALRAAI